MSGVGSHIHISEKEEVIPGTRERICTITGSLQGLLQAQHYISDILAENKRERQMKDLPPGAPPPEEAPRFAAGCLEW